MSTSAGYTSNLQEQLLAVLLGSAIPLAAADTVARIQLEHSSTARHFDQAAELTRHAAIQGMLQLIIWNSRSEFNLDLICSQVGTHIAKIRNNLMDVLFACSPAIST
jgi:hypothetical protein